MYDSYFLSGAEDIDPFDRGQAFSVLDEAYGGEFDEIFGDELAFGEDVDFGEVLRGALHEDYEEALPEELSEAVMNIFDSLSPAESFNIGTALSQIQKGAGQIVEDPAFGQVASGVLPIAGGAIGTYVGG